MTHHNVAIHRMCPILPLTPWKFFRKWNCLLFYCGYANYFFSQINCFTRQSRHFLPRETISCVSKFSSFSLIVLMTRRNEGKWEARGADSYTDRFSLSRTKQKVWRYRRSSRRLQQSVRYHSMFLQVQPSPPTTPLFFTNAGESSIPWITVARKVCSQLFFAPSISHSLLSHLRTSSSIRIFSRLSSKFVCVSSSCTLFR